MFGRLAVGNDVDGGAGDLVVLILLRFLFEAVDEHFEIGFGNRSEQLVRGDVVQIDHAEFYRCRQVSGLDG